MARSSKTKKRNIGHEEVRGEDEAKQDRLSSLPDDILLDILSHFCLKSAAKTSILSRRWRHLWTHTKSIHISNCFCDNIFKFCEVLDDVLMRFTISTLRTFSLNFLQLPKSCERSRTWSLKDSGFRRICSENLEVLRVCATGYASDFNLLPPPPACIFETPTLVELELGPGLRHNLPVRSDLINLPNLKKLSMNDVLCSQWVLFDKLIKSCPSLEELFISSYRHDQSYAVASICGPNLKRLNMHIFQTGEIVIDGPRLEYFNLTAGCNLSVRCVKNPIALIEADIVNYAHQSDGRCMSELYGEFSSVRSLKIECPQLGVPKLFHNLIYLKLSLRFSTVLEGLLPMLNSCPVLEILVFSIIDDVGYDKKWIHKEFTAPECLCTHVKRIEIESLWDLKSYFLDLVKYLLRSAQVLELLVFSKSGNAQRGLVDDEQVHRELLFCKDIYESHRSSSKCQIEFSGYYLKVPREGKSVRCPNA